MALGPYSSGASFLGYGAGFVGARIVARSADSARVILIAVAVGRFAFVAMPTALLLAPTGSVPLLVAILLLWCFAEGVAAP